MKTRIFSIVAIAAVVSLGACKKDEGGSSTTQADTTTQTTVVPTTDTMQTKTTTTTTVDTAKVDSTNHGAMGTTTAPAPATTDTTKKM
jgi:hypothetical protein